MKKDKRIGWQILIQAEDKESIRIIENLHQGDLVTLDFIVSSKNVPEFGEPRVIVFSLSKPVSKL